MASQYKSTYPATPPVPPGVKQFLERFYVLSDDGGAHEEYADQFTSDATLIMGNTKAEGHDDIVALRHKMWVDVISRKHNPIQVFPFNSPIGTSGFELMLHGTVGYVLKAGGNESRDWAARAHLTMNPKNRTWKMLFYQVYLDTASRS